MSHSELKITVLIPCYNSELNILNNTLLGLKCQTLPTSFWELIIVDNNSSNNVLTEVDLSWHPQVFVTYERKQGLSYARLAGFKNANASIVVMVDDDNVLHPDYLLKVWDHFKNNSILGALGGKIEGKFVGYVPEKWTEQFLHMVAIRDFGEHAMISESRLEDKYPWFAPVGAGMAIRHHLLQDYWSVLSRDKNALTDRSGENLSSGGDNELIVQVLLQGFSVGYFPDLSLEHLIPASRLTRNYLARLNFESSRSWVQLLRKYNICPWIPIKRFTLLFRKIKAWFKHKAWRNHENYIKWKGACGMFEGLTGKYGRA